MNRQQLFVRALATSARLFLVPFLTAAIEERSWEARFIENILQPEVSLDLQRALADLYISAIEIAYHKIKSDLRKEVNQKEFYRALIESLKQWYIARQNQLPRLTCDQQNNYRLVCRWLLLEA